jgi:hypothetical protein
MMEPLLLLSTVVLVKMAVAKKKIARTSVMIISHVRSSVRPLNLFEFPYVFDCTHDH